MPIFKIKNIVINDNMTIKEEYIQSELKEVYGTNIFFVRKKNIENELVKLSEISQVDVKKVFPDTLIIDTLEKNHMFYIKSGLNFFLIDETGFIFDVKDNLDDNDIILLEGININGLEVNTYVTEDNRQQKLIKDLTDLFIYLDSSLDKPDIVNIESLIDIKISYNNMCIIIGDSENLKDKVNKGINILNNNNLYDKKGYIDVSYTGNPVFKIEK
ncbi:cell division protein FtsQ/DivIB [Clostridium sp. DL1XJH146]